MMKLHNNAEQNKNREAELTIIYTAARNIPFFLLGIATLVIIGIVLNSNQLDFQFLTFYVGIIIGTIALIASYNWYLLSRQAQALHFHLLFLITAICCGIGLGLLQSHMVDAQLLLNNGITVTAGLYIALYCVTALAFFDFIYRYFFIFVCCCALPSLADNSSLLLSNWTAPVVFDVGLYYAGLFITSYFLCKGNKEYALLNHANILQLNKIQDQFEALAKTKSQLEKEIGKRTLTESQLLSAKKDLEKQIFERTHELRQLNDTLENSKHNLEMANKIAGIGTWDWDIRNHTLELTNSQQILGYTNSELMLKMQDVNELIHPEDITKVKTSLQRHFLGQLELHDLQYRIKNAQGEWSWVHDIGQVIEKDPLTNRSVRMLGIRRDITAEVLSAEKLKLSSKVFEHATQGFFILEKDFTIIEANKYLRHIIGHERPINNENISAYLNVSESDEAHNTSMLKLSTSTGEYEGESSITDQHGQARPIWLHINAIYDDKGNITHYVGIVSDLTQRKAAEKRLTYLANYDSLTELPNRNLFMTQLHELIMNAIGENKVFSLLRINIDRFRSINDSLGADGADTLLKAFAKHLLFFDPESYIVSRLGADDFVLVKVNFHHDPQSIYNYSQRLISHFEKKLFIVDRQEVVMNISIGIALFPEQGRQIDTLLNHAESALISAKRLGGQASRFYQQTGELPAIDRLALEQEFRKALVNDEICVYFQPKLDIKTNRICGFEALARWIHPLKGVIPPAQFISLAEENGLISALGELIFEKTCQQVVHFNLAQYQDMRISVNIVVQQIQRGNLVEMIDRILKETRVDPSLLEVEITESSLMNDTTEVNSFLNEMSSRNIDVALDDFGTGYSCLAYLSKFSINTLKIDRAFIAPLGHEHDCSRQESIVSAILALGHSLGMKVIAEGVETEEQLDFLSSIGCDLIQGFLVHRPLPTSELGYFISKHTNDEQQLSWVR